MPRSKRQKYIRPRKPEPTEGTIAAAREARVDPVFLQHVADKPYQPVERQPIRDAMEDQWERGVATVAAGYAELRRVFLETRDFDRNEFMVNDSRAQSRAQTIRIGELANELKACEYRYQVLSKMAQSDNRLLREKNEQLARAAQRIVELESGWTMTKDRVLQLADIYAAARNFSPSIGSAARVSTLTEVLKAAGFTIVDK
jgi:hypothetical protein